MMKTFFRNKVVQMIAALAAVGIISGITLVFVYNYSMPKIKVNISRETELAIKNIFPDVARTESIERAGRNAVFEVKDKNGKLLGYAFIAEGNGYQGTIKLLAGIDTELSTLQGMEVLESQETPGLGAEIASEDFRKQFKGLSVTQPIEYIKNRKPEKPYQIEAITGATISSRAVVTILNKKIKEIHKLLKTGK